MYKTIQLFTSLLTENRNTYKCKTYLNTKLINVLGRLKLFMIFGFNEIMSHHLNKGLIKFLSLTLSIIAP